MRTPWMTLLPLLWSCGEVDEEEPTASTPGVETPATGGTETAGETTGDTATGGSDGLDLGCADREVSYDLEVAWESPWWAYDVAVTRMEDGDGDGEVDLGDPVQLVTATGDEDGQAVYVYDYGSTVRRRDVEGAWRAYARPADVDGVAGAEVVASWYVWREDGDWLGVARDGGDELFAIPEGSSTYPWLADVNGDGQLDALLAGAAYDLVTGEDVARLGNTQDSPKRVAVDLDLDGQVEILTATGNATGGSDLGILGEGGVVDAPCARTDPGWSTVFFAVGDLDGDPEGEFVVASINRITVCDSDGSMLHSLAVDLEQPSMVALGDLDGDLLPEIVVTGAHWPEHPRYPVLVMDRQLRALWSEDRTSWAPLSLADLDADGDHELLILAEERLELRDGDGSELGRWELADGLEMVSWHAQPIVADVDRDGLGEIVLPMSTLVVLDTPAGGFPAGGAAAGWSGLDHFPGYTDAVGTVDAAGAHWLTPGHNAWNAQPACVEGGEE